MHHCLVLLLCTIFFVCRCVTLTLTAFFLYVKFVSSKKGSSIFLNPGSQKSISA